MFTQAQIEALDNTIYSKLETAFNQHFNKQYKNITDMVNGEAVNAKSVEEAAQQVIDSWHESI